MIHIIYMYHLPNEVIIYIWEYDSTYYDKYKLIINELNRHFITYNKTYYEYTRLYKRMIWNGYIKKTKHFMEWFHKFGVNYDPGYYILNQNTNKKYNSYVDRGIKPFL